MSTLSDYYPTIDKQKLRLLERLWEYAKSLEPEATEGLSYGLPALRLDGRPLIGFSNVQNHMSVYPFSPKIIDAVRGDLPGFDIGKGVIRFTEEQPLPLEIIEVMIRLRKDQLRKR